MKLRRSTRKRPDSSFSIDIELLSTILKVSYVTVAPSPPIDRPLQFPTTLHTYHTSSVNVPIPPPIALTGKHYREGADTGPRTNTSSTLADTYQIYPTSSPRAASATPGLRAIEQPTQGTPCDALRGCTLTPPPWALMQLLQVVKPMLTSPSARCQRIHIRMAFALVFQPTTIPALSNARARH